MPDRWRGPSLPSTTTAKEESFGWILALWHSPSHSSPSLPSSASARWCTDGDQRLAESWAGPGLQRSWPPCYLSACGSCTSCSPHWRPIATSRASKMMMTGRMVEETGGGGWMDGFRNKVVSLIQFSLPPFHNRLNDGWMERCTDWKTGGCIQAFKNIMEGSMNAWKDNSWHENHRGLEKFAQKMETWWEREYIFCLTLQIQSSCLKPTHVLTKTLKLQTHNVSQLALTWREQG